MAEHRLRERRQSATAQVIGSSLFVIGGLTGTTIRADYERLDLATGQSKLFALPTPGRTHHSAILLDERIYVFGGLVPGEPTVPVGTRSRDPGAMISSMRSVSADITTRVIALDAQGLVNDQAGSMPAARFNMGAVVLGTKVHLLGGTSKSGPRSRESERHDIYDLKTGQWSRAAPLLAPQACHAVRLDRLIIVAGGGRLGRSSKGVFAYDSALDGWRMLKPLPHPVGGHSLAILGRFLFLFGNYDDANEVVAYDLSSQSGYRLRARFGEMLHSAAVVHGNRIYVVGGMSSLKEDSDLVQVFELNPQYAP